MQNNDFLDFLRFLYAGVAELVAPFMPSVAGAWVSVYEMAPSKAKAYAFVFGGMIGFLAGNAIVEYFDMQGKRYLCAFLTFSLSYFGLEIFQQARKSLPSFIDLIAKKFGLGDQQ